MLSAVVIGHNSKQYLETCLRGLQGQAVQPSEILYIDCASSDGSADLVESLFPRIEILRSPENLGFSRAANFGIRSSRSEFILILNPDMRLAASYCEECLRELRSDPLCAGVIGKIFRYDDEDRHSSSVIDTTGLVITRNRRVLDRGAGRSDCSDYDAPSEIFGIPGNSPIYRRAALEDAAINGEVFDEDFFMYKEDTDLSWRLRLLGWTFRYVPGAIGFHDRSTGVVPRRSLGEIVKARRGLNPMQGFLSYKNHRLMLVKNELLSTLSRDILSITSWELASLGWVILREPQTAVGIPQLLRQLPIAYRKRRVLMSRRRVDTDALDRWLGGH